MAGRSSYCCGLGAVAWLEATAAEGDAAAGGVAVVAGVAGDSEREVQPVAPTRAPRHKREMENREVVIRMK